MESESHESNPVSENLFLSTVVQDKQEKFRSSSNQPLNAAKVRKRMAINQSLVNAKVNVEALLSKMIKNKDNISEIEANLEESEPKIEKKITRKRKQSVLDEILNLSANEPGIGSPTKKGAVRELQRYQNVNDSLCLTENEDEKEVFSFVISLGSVWKTVYDCILMSAVLYLFVMTPIVLAFPELESESVFSMFIAIDTLFLLDIVFNFFIPYYNYEDELIVQNKKIALHYLNSTFLLDLIAGIPGTFWGKNSFNPLFKLIKLYKISRFTSKSRSKRFKWLDEFNLSEKKSRVLSFCVGLLLTAHILNGIWIYICTQSDNIPLITLLNYGKYSAIYVDSLYFTLATVFTIGYGDVVPISSTERLYTIFLMMFGVILYSYGVTSLSTVVTSYDQLTSKYKANVEILDDIKARKNLPDGLYARLLKFLNYEYKINMSQRTEFIKELPRNAKITLVFNMYADFIRNVKFLEDRSKSFIIKVIFYMNSLKVVRKECLIYENEIVYEVFFVRSGVLNVNLGVKFDETKVINIRRNEHFGDVLAMSEERSPFNLKAGQSGDLLLLKKRDLDDLAKNFKEELENVMKISFYNYAAMIELADQKKKKFMRESQVERLENSFDVTHLETKIINVAKLKKEDTPKTATMSSKLFSKDKKAETIKVGSRFNSSKLLKAVNANSLSKTLKRRSNMMENWKAENEKKSTFSRLMVGGMNSLIDERREIENNPQKFFRQKVAALLEKHENESEIKEQLGRLGRVFSRLKRKTGAFHSSSESSCNE